MSDRIPVWGIGIKLTFLTMGYSFIVIFLHYLTYPLFYIEFLPYALFKILGIFFILLGLPLFIVSGFSVHKAYAEDVLRTKGVYSICQHPLYSSFLVFIVPGVCLLFKSWLLLSVPFAMYIFFRILIKEEEDYLSERFAGEYEKYSKATSFVFPKIWRCEK
jgi:protein-S-isoprenylcysteine O-methyltransferase Ste14